jgi:hypothetical protein
MKSIQPITSWIDGQQQQATNISLSSTGDNLKSSASFYYVLTDNSNQPIAQGTLVMDGQDYIDWGLSSDINEEAYIWAAQKLNLVLIQ